MCPLPFWFKPVSTKCYALRKAQEETLPLSVPPFISIFNLTPSLARASAHYRDGALISLAGTQSTKARQFGQKLLLSTFIDCIAD